MSARFGIVDLFAGPGGLGEGFASFRVGGHFPFRIGISIEKEASAHQTLRLRAFLRECRAMRGQTPLAFIDFHAGRTPAPNWASVEPAAWRRAGLEARQLELGSDAATEAVGDATAALRRDFDDTILIGGPPCQAYSLVGRARAKGKRDYVPEDDERHYLFREYIRVLDRLRPAAFVMENVKGMLSSTVEGRFVFEMLMEDLASLGGRRRRLYELRAIRVADGRASLEAATRPADFIVRAEDFGVPQRRHRVVIVGIRSDLARRASRAAIALPGVAPTVGDVIGAMPALRSGLSRVTDDAATWRGEVIAVAERLRKSHKRRGVADLGHAFSALVASMKQTGASLTRMSSELPEGYGSGSDEVLRWLETPGLRALAQHETRGHMASDLGRYLFAAVFGSVRGYSPKAPDFPVELSPDHQNWRSGVFSDRFRVQLAGEPSTTVTSHIAKDGHYFIHPDPGQCRSLTVREAARLQTFPDDYLFLGNRTQQYVQVGNAVPPFLALKIAALIHEALTDDASLDAIATHAQTTPV